MLELSDYPILLAVFLAFLLIPAARHFTRNHLLDHPNNRSSHTLPRSRAGGLGFGAAWFLVCIAALAPGLDRWDLLSPVGSDGAPLSPAGEISQITVWFLVGAMIIWINGLLDDFFQLPARYRILVQALGVAAGILGPDVFRQTVNPGLLVLIYLGLVYFINAFNFMDGTDGLAASEGIFILLTVFLLGHESIAFGALATVLCVFLFWNLPRAHIFMGDAGSNLIGYVAGYALLQLFLKEPSLAFLIPVLFTADATLTLLVRLFRNEAFYLAHRNHTYQHLARRWGHGPVLVGLWTTNLGILFLAFTLRNVPSETVYWFVAVVHLAILAVFYRLGAGRPFTEI